MPKHLIEGFVDREGEHDEKEKGNSEDKKQKYGKIYDEEQKKSVKEVLEAAGKEDLEDGEGDFFTVKKAGEDRGNDDNEEFEKKLDEYFGEDVESNETFKFLKSYFMNKMWIDKNKENSNFVAEELQGISEDEREIEKQEEYEFRFQENQGDRVLGI